MLPESEAMKLAIVFEETGAYTYKKNKEAEGKSGGGGGGGNTAPGLRAEFEEDFSFGENDDTDYWHFKDNGVEIVD